MESHPLIYTHVQCILSPKSGTILSPVVSRPPKDYGSEKKNQCKVGMHSCSYATTEVTALATDEEGISL